MSKELGFTNEDVIAGIFKERGCIVEKSLDRYDMKKDLLIDGVETEVKLQTLYYFFKTPGHKSTHNAFTIPITEDYKVHSNQLSKCMNVERLIFTQIPTRKFMEKSVKIWEAPPVGKRYFSVSRNKHDGRYIAGLPLSDMTLIHEIFDTKYVEHLRNSGTSYF